jgi:putative DNA primase/helicase
MVTSGRNWGARYFHEDIGLMAVKAANDLIDLGPLRYSLLDASFWTYAGGMWSVDKLEVHRRVVKLLGERYRRTHSQSIRDVLTALVDELWVGPTEQINLANGMLVWNAPAEPELTPHGPEFGSTNQLPVAWDPTSLCPLFDAFLASVVSEDDRARVWEVLGYLIMGGNPLQRMFLLTGLGGNGKGVLLAVIRALIGERNTAAVPLHAFVNDRFAPADLYGKLVNIVGEIPAVYIEDTSKIKELAGEDLIRAERKNGQPFQFEFWGKSIFSANSLPSSADSSTGWTRRWEIIDFPNTPAKPDRGLKARLTSERELRGILVKAVLSLRALMDRGEFVRGEAATAIHHEFAKRSNKLLAWVDDDCVMEPSGWYLRKDVLQRFRRWDRISNPGSREMGMQAFYDKFRQVPGVSEVKRNGHMGFKGLRFVDDVAYGAELVIDPERELPQNAPGQSVQLAL